MNEVTANRDQENEAFGSFLLESVASIYGCAPTPGMIAKMVYKYSDCGAYIHFDDQGIIVGTIVEGSDAEYYVRISLDGIDTDVDGAKELRRRVNEALDDCENFVDESFCMLIDDEDD